MIYPAYETLKLNASLFKVRLVHIEPLKDESAPVRCTLHKIRLNQHSRFEALSYV
jgi:hypothetical protein